MLRLIKDAIPFTVYVIGFLVLITLWISGILMIMGSPIFIMIAFTIAYTAFMGFIGHMFVNTCSNWSID